MTVSCWSGLPRDISITDVASGVADRAALHQFGGFRVFHRDVACRSDQVRLLDAQLAHLRRVVGISEEVEDQLEAVRTFRQQLTCNQRVVNLLDHQLREDRLDMIGGVFFVFGNETEDGIVFEREAFVERADVLLLVGGRCVFARLRHRNDAVQTVRCIGYRARLHADAENVERRMEQVQHARVIRVLHILEIELPVRLRILARAAKVLDRLVKDAVDPRAAFPRRGIQASGTTASLKLAKTRPSIALHPQACAGCDSSDRSRRACRSCLSDRAGTARPASCRCCRNSTGGTRRCASLRCRAPCGTRTRRDARSG